MGLTNGEQWRQLLFCGGMGFLLGAYYDIFFDRVYRFGTRRFFLDILFCISGALFLFLFALGAMNGKLRLYLFVGTAIGFAVYRRTVGRAYRRMVRALTVVQTAIARRMAVFLQPIGLFYRKFEKKFQNRRKNCKKLLKAAERIVYNHTVLRFFGGRRNREDEKQTQKEK